MVQLFDQSRKITLSLTVFSDFNRNGEFANISTNDVHIDELIPNNLNDEIHLLF